MWRDEKVLPPMTPSEKEEWKSQFLLYQQQLRQYLEQELPPPPPQEEADEELPPLPSSPLPMVRQAADGKWQQELPPPPFPL